MSAGIYLLTSKREWGYDEAQGFVVCAWSSREARLTASKKAGDEGADTWLEPACSDVVEIGTALAAFDSTRVVLRDFNAG